LNTNNKKSIDHEESKGGIFELAKSIEKSK